MSIKSLELNPTKDNLITTLQNDLLDRNKDVWYFAKICDEIDEGYSIAIDAKWGQGKTFFVRHVQMLLESFNDFTTALTDEDKRIIKNVFAQFIGRGERRNGFDAHVCVYYDAWANDNDEDPVLSLVYSILQGTAQRYKFKKSAEGVKAFTSIFDFFTGRNLSDVVEASRGKDFLEDLKTKKEINRLVNELVDALLDEQGNHLTVFIDELDRCKPDYAVQLLERIKHYFTNDRITFVFSVNIDELQHTIKCHYGEGFDACRYLDRFFDLRITLPPADMEKYYRSIGINNPRIFERVCMLVANEFGLGIRETEKFFRMAKIAAFKPTFNSAWGFDNDNGKLFARCFIVPIIIGLKMTDTKMYNDFVNGKDPQPLISIVLKGDFDHQISALLRNEKLKSDKDEITVVSNEFLLTNVYHAIFDENEKQTLEPKHIGRCAFSDETKNDVLQIASLLSNQAQYE